MGKIKNIPFRVFCYVLMIVFLFIYLFPLFFVANTSLKTSQDYMLHPTSLTTTWAKIPSGLSSSAALRQ